MKTRHGKIARLPKEIREQLNRRMENGWRGARLVNWLNELPQVKEVVTSHAACNPGDHSRLRCSSVRPAPNCIVPGRLRLLPSAFSLLPSKRTPSGFRFPTSALRPLPSKCLKVYQGISRYIKVDKGGEGQGDLQWVQAGLADHQLKSHPLVGRLL
jgi:hypothetical protein